MAKKIRSTPASWTVMVLMGADNLPNEKSLAAAADSDLGEMVKAFKGASKSGPDILRVVVQLDRSKASGGPKRYLIDRSGRQELDMPGGCSFEEGIPGTEVLGSFVVWAKKQYPARHYMLVLWGHAYDLAFNRDTEDPGGLDFPELRAILEATNAGRKLDIVAFDSCNVSLLEGAYELRNVADFLVASQFTDPTPGWKYDVTFERILKDPGLSGESGPRDLGRAIVSQFVRAYEGQESVTMTLLDLDQAGAVAEAMRTLAADLTVTVAGDASERANVERMFERSRVPIRQSSVDLTAFCWNLLYFSQYEGLRVAAAAVGDLLFRPSSPFIVAHGKSDLLVAMLQGVSIMAPNVISQSSKDLASLRSEYDKLEFSTQTDWGKLVFALS